jgi:hypothetical protein
LLIGRAPGRAYALDMTMRRDPERDYRARRAIILGRFTTGAHVVETDAERWIAGWETQAAVLGLRRDSRTYWSTGLRWIAGQRELREHEAGALRDVS